MHEILFDQYKVEIQYSATKAQTERLTVSPPFPQNKKIFAPDKQNNLWSVWQFDGAFLSGNAISKFNEEKPPAERLTGLERNIKQQQASNKKIPKYLFQNDVVQRVWLKLTRKVPHISVGFQGRDINNIRKAVESTKGWNCVLFVNRSETQRLFFLVWIRSFHFILLSVKNGDYWMLQKMTMEKFEKF